MSRTDKDRPWRVRAMDPTEPREARHDHLHLGGTRKRYVHTGKVERVLVEYGDPVWILRDKHDTSGMTHEESVNAIPRRVYWGAPLAPIPCREHLRWYFEKRTSYRYTNQTIVEEPLPDYCTIDEPDNRHNPCGYWIHYKNYYLGHSMTEAVHIDYHRPERQRERIGKKNLRDEYNTFGDVDDSQWQDYQHRHAPGRGGWWD
jgi:hypothetical protein